MKEIVLQGVRTHNLKNIDVSMPRDQLVVITGLSGSGKSSLAFDTIYAEGQRRYVESLSAYARQFLSVMPKPDVDLIEGLSPAIAIEQKTTSHNPRSTVGTITEIYDYMRLLYARVGTPCCPTHDIELKAQTVTQMVDMVMTITEGTPIMILAPVVRGRKGEHHKLLARLQAQGYLRARVNGEIVELDDMPTLNAKQKHEIEVVIDRLKVKPGIEQRVAESIDTALALAEGLVYIGFMQPGVDELVFSERFACPECGYSLEELTPRMFSFNNPKGACPTCEGLGVAEFFDISKIISNPNLSVAGGAIRGWNRRNYYYYQLLSCLASHYKFDMDQPFNQLPKNIQDILLNGSGDEVIEFTYRGHNDSVVTKQHAFEGVLPNMKRRYHETDSVAVRDDLAKYLTMSECSDCQGARLRLESRHVYIGGEPISHVSDLSIQNALDFFTALTLSGQKEAVAFKIIKEIKSRLEFLVNVGLDYLSLSRSANTLSGGETQRIRLASQIGSGLVGVMYILDEPSIGLHQKDNERLLATLQALRDLGNSVLVVEHDEDAILMADYVLDVGPGAGVHGGHIIAQGTPEEIKKNKQSLTGRYLSGELSIEVPKQRVQNTCRSQIKIEKAFCHNLKELFLKNT